MRRALFSGVALSTMLSLGLALGLAFTTDVGVRVSILIGLLSTAIGLGIRGFIAARDQLSSIERARVTSLTQLQGLTAVPELERPILRIIGSTAQAKEHRGSFLAGRAIESVSSFCASLDDIAHGSLLCHTPEEELHLVEVALSETTDRVRAVATRGVDWWRKPESDAYFRAYERHADRLHTIRIFLVPRSDFDNMRPVLERHHASGIDTYALDREQVERPQRGIVLFDSALLHRMRHEEHSDRYVVEFTDVAEQIRIAEEYFDYLLGLADSVNDEFVLFRPAARRRKALRTVRRALKPEPPTVG